MALIRILASTNNDVDEINSIILFMIPGDVKTYLSCDTLSNFNDCGAFSDIKPPELLHSLKILGLSNHCLELKVGALVILQKFEPINWVVQWHWTSCYKNGR